MSNTRPSTIQRMWQSVVALHQIRNALAWHLGISGPEARSLVATLSESELRAIAELIRRQPDPRGPRAHDTEFQASLQSILDLAAQRRTASPVLSPDP